MEKIPLILMSYVSKIMSRLCFCHIQIICQEVYLRHRLTLSLIRKNNILVDDFLNVTGKILIIYC